MKGGPYCLLFLLFFLCTSCSTTRGVIARPSTDHKPLDTGIDARDIVLELKQTNKNLDTFKGIGSFSLRHEGAVRLKERIAWIGAAPVRLRAVILASGHPVLKLASDGKWLYIHDLRDPLNTIRKLPTRDPNLKRLIPIPIRSSDLLTLLSGRIPLCDHHSLSLTPDPSSDGHILFLKKWWWVVEKIYLDKNASNPNQVEVFNFSGSLRYRARLASPEKVGEYRIPMKIEISDAENTNLAITVDRYWPNVSVSSAMFVLNASD